MSAGPSFCLLVWFGFIAKAVSLDVCLPCPFCPLGRSSPALPLPAHATSPKPQTKTPCFPLEEEAFPLPPAACILPCQPGEASSLRSLSIPSLGEMNTCGLGYQYFNFCRLISGDSWFQKSPPPPQSIRRLPACSRCPIMFSLLFAHGNYYLPQVISKQEPKSSASCTLGALDGVMGERI